MRLSALEGDGLPDASPPGASVSSWVPVEVPRGRRASPVFLAVLGVLAGIGAMALGTVAVITAAASSSPDDPIAPPRVAAAPSGVERALAFLANPSTNRIPFTGSGGRLLLAVGTDGRAAILSRGLEQAAARTRYYAWAVAPGARPVRVAQFGGAERVVFLSVRLGPRASVVVSTDPSAPRRAGVRLVAARG